MHKPTLNEKILSIISGLNSKRQSSGKMSALRNADWQAIITAIQKTGMSGYFSALFFQTKADSEIPVKFVDTLRMAARRVAAHNVFYESRCAGILQGLSAAGVENIMLKGLSYMEDIYGDTSARTMSDIDLLIHPDDRIKALEYLLAEGYTNYVIPSFQGGQDAFTHLTDLIGEAHFMKKSGALTISIDLHWRLRAHYPMNNYLALDGFPWWENTGTVLIGGITAKRLSPEMQFIHLALHFALHHQYTGLRWFIELALFLKRYGNDLDWEFIYTTAASPDGRKLLGVCLRLVADYMGDSWPGAANWRRFLHDSTMLPGEYRFYKSCLMREDRSRLASYICMPLCPATLEGRLRMISHFLFDSQGVILWRESGVRIPKWLRPVYNIYIISRQLLRGRHA